MSNKNPHPTDGSNDNPANKRPPAGASDTHHGPPDTNSVPATPDTRAHTPTEAGRTRTFVDPRTVVVPGYEILEQLAEGGMGVVFKARQTRLERVVALKMIHGSGPVAGEELFRFLAEAAAVAAIEHDNVVRVYESGEHAGRPYIALEFLAGGTLADRFKRARGARTSSSRSFPDVARLVERVARGVAAAHALGIVHRDLKPANVLFDDGDTPKVADFGLAKRAGGSDMTHTGQALGTPAYMSPEQAKGDTKFVGPQADVWALGVILYEALTGGRPFVAANNMELMMKIGTDEPVPPRKVVPSVPLDLELICLKCLSKVPHERYPTAEELADDLDRYARGQPISVRPARVPERAYKWVKRNKVVAGAMAAVFLALAAGAGVALAFGLEARKQEGIARTKADDAERHKGVAKKEAADAVQAQFAADRNAAKAEAEAQRATAAARDLAAQLKETRRVFDLSRLVTSQTVFDNNLVQLARDTLDEVAPENRCPAWWLLQRRFEGSPVTFRLQGYPPFPTALSADGSQVVTGSNDGTVRTWDARTGRNVGELKLQQKVSSLALSADGARVAVGTGDGTLAVRDAKTGQVLAELKGDQNGFWRVAVSADGGRVVAARRSARSVQGETLARVLDLKTKRVTELKGHTGGVTGVAISADGSRVVVASEQAPVRVWDVGSGAPLLELPRQPEPVRNVAVSADASRIVVASDDVVRVYNGATGSSLAEFREPTRAVRNVAVSADGSRVAVGLLNGAVDVWDARSGQTVAELKGHTSSVWAVAVSADGSRVVSSSDDGTVRVWDARDRRTPAKRLGDSGRVDSGVVSGDGSRVAARSDDGTVRVWDARTGQLVFEVKTNTIGIQVAVALSGDGGIVATGAQDGTVRLWDKTGQPGAALKAHKGWASRLAVSHDGSVVASGATDGTLRVWDARTGLSTELKGYKQSVAGIALSADGSRLATAGAETAHVWDAKTGLVLTELKGHTSQLRGVAISADGNRVVTAAGTAKVWDAKTGQMIAELKGHKGEVFGAALTADGTRIVTGSSDNRVLMWDTRTGQSLIELKHTEPVYSVALSADGGQLVTSADGAVWVWDAGPAPLPVEFKHPGPTEIQVSADGSRLIAGSHSGDARIWDAKTGQLLAELAGPTRNVMRANFSVDQAQILTQDGAGTIRIWDAVTGQLLPNAPIPALQMPTYRTPDGEFEFFRGGARDRIVKVPTRIEEGERLRRLWLTRPDPDWHVRRQKELAAEGNDYGAAVQRSFESYARGTLALDAGDLEGGRRLLVTAGTLKPPTPPAIVPPPATIPLAN